jgi:hypothetical protein
MRYSVGDRVLVSRAETGEDHERGVVIDSYELIIGEERKPMVVVEFEDGERKYMTAATPNVLPDYEAQDEEPEAAESGADEPEEDEADEPDEVHEPSQHGEVFFVDEDDEGASP